MDALGLMVVAPFAGAFLVISSTIYCFTWAKTISNGAL
jgi:hypothetical protein